jgi:putrescine transport system substrate-binding protein
MWGFVTVGINTDKVKAALGSTPMPANPLDLIFKPEYASKLKGCGITCSTRPARWCRWRCSTPARTATATTPRTTTPRAAVLKPRGRRHAHLLARAHQRPGAGQLCVSLGYSGDFNIANQRAIEGKTGQNIQALIPPRGATLFFDTMAIPKDAKHPKNAHLFINYILRPRCTPR